MVPRTLFAFFLLALLTAPAAGAATPKERKLAKVIQKKVADGRYIGTRGDGESIDDTFCANGRYSSNVGGGLSIGRSWKIVHPTGTRKNFAAIVKSGSFSMSIARANGQWQIGYESFDEPQALGDVERTDAKAACRTL